MKRYGIATGLQRTAGKVPIGSFELSEPLLIACWSDAFRATDGSLEAVLQILRYLAELTAPRVVALVHQEKS